MVVHNGPQSAVQGSAECLMTQLGLDSLQLAWLLTVPLPLTPQCGCAAHIGITHNTGRTVRFNPGPTAFTGLYGAHLGDH